MAKRTRDPFNPVAFVSGNKVGPGSTPIFQGGKGAASGFQGSIPRAVQKVLDKAKVAPKKAAPKGPTVKEQFVEQRKAGEKFRAGERELRAEDRRRQNSAIDAFVGRISQQDAQSTFLKWRKRYEKEAVIDANAGRTPDTLENWLSANGVDPATIFADRAGLGDFDFENTFPTPRRR